MAKETLRILMVLNNFGIGGIQTYVLTMSKELIKQGVKVFVSGEDGLFKDMFIKAGCHVDTDCYKKVQNDFKSWLHENEIDLINVHHGYSRISKLKLDVPIVYTVHSVNQNVSDFTRLRRNTPNVISVSIPIQMWLEALKISSVVIPNGVDTELFRYAEDRRLRKTFGIGRKDPVVLYASRLSGRKGEIGRLVLKAATDHLFKEFPNLHVLISGDGDKNKDIRESIDTKYRRQIHMLGFNTDMPPLYSLSNCVVGTGRVALEAMACERTVISVGSKGVLGIVKPKRYKEAWQHYFADHSSKGRFKESHLAYLIKKVLQSRAKQLYWGKRGRVWVKHNFDISSVAKQVLDYYVSILNEERRG